LHSCTFGVSKNHGRPILGGGDWATGAMQGGRGIFQSPAVWITRMRLESSEEAKREEERSLGEGGVQKNGHRRGRLTGVLLQRDLGGWEGGGVDRVTKERGGEG